MTGRLTLLDTNVVLALVRGNQLADRIEAEYSLRTSATRPLISIVTHGEIRVLAERRGWGAAKRAALQTALDNLVTVDIHHPDVLDAYVELDLASQAHPGGARNMGKNDLWIASCSKAAGARLLTTDRDFLHLAPNLLEVCWVDPRTT